MANPPSAAEIVFGPIPDCSPILSKSTENASAMTAAPIPTRLRGTSLSQLMMVSLRSTDPPFVLDDCAGQLAAVSLDSLPDCIAPNTSIRGLLQFLVVDLVR